MYVRWLGHQVIYLSPLVSFIMALHANRSSFILAHAIFPLRLIRYIGRVLFTYSLYGAIFGGLGLMYGLTGCDVNPGQAQATAVVAATSDVPNRFQLRKKIREERRITVIYGTGDPGHAARYLEWLQNPKNQMRWLTLTYLPDTAVADTILTKHNLILLGTFDDHLIISKLADQLPFQPGSQQFQFDHTSYSEPVYSFSLGLYPNPFAQQNPLSILTGNSLEAIMARLNAPKRTSWNNSLLGNWGYEIRKGESLLVAGNFTDDWALDPDQKWIFETNSGPTYQSPHYAIFTHSNTLAGPDQNLADIAAQLEERVNRVSLFLERDIEAVPLTYHIYPHAELMGLMTQHMQQAYLDERKERLHRIYHPALADNDIGLETQWWLQKTLGEPSFSCFQEGLSIYFAETWQKRGYAYWSSCLSRSHNSLSLGELLDDQAFKQESHLIRGCMAASLVAFLIEQWGKEVFLSRYTSWQPSTQEMTDLAPRWEAFLLTQAESQAANQGKSSSLPYARGITLAHEGYQIYNGYGSQEAEKALNKIHSISANAVAIVPYTGARSTTKPMVYPVWQSAGSENDMAVVFAQYHARTLDMISLLKPQIWFSGGWPGSVKMENEEDWQAFFGHYRKWIRHYAMLAAIHESDAFCVGVEFVHATLGHPDVWRTLIQDLRHIYPGPITYAANWGREAEEIAFADALDFVGVNSYYPLSNDLAASQAQLDTGAGKIIDKLERLHRRTGKPIVLTEVGFRSVDACWQQPHDEPNGRTFEADHQAQAYQAMLKALDGKTWCQGMYWWKWPTYLGYAQETPRSFTPCGKPAEKVLQNYFTKWASSR